MESPARDNSGFTLLEIMVTVAIIGIMAGSVVVGWGSFSKTVRLQETKGVISDIVGRLALEMTRREYDAQLVHFGQDYLIVEAKPADEGLSLRWNGQGSCGPGKEELEIDNSGSPETVYLASSDAHGNTTGILDTVGPMSTGTYCAAFADADTSEQRYQAFSGSGVSQTVRFIHFNLQRDNPVRITDGNDVTLELRGSYAAKRFFRNGNPETERVELTLESDESFETLVLQQ